MMMPSTMILTLCISVVLKRRPNRGLSLDTGSRYERTEHKTHNSNHKSQKLNTISTTQGIFYHIKWWGISPPAPWFAPPAPFQRFWFDFSTIALYKFLCMYVCMYAVYLPHQCFAFFRTDGWLILSQHLNELIPLTNSHFALKLGVCHFYALIDQQSPLPAGGLA